MEYNFWYHYRTIENSYFIENKIQFSLNFILIGGEELWVDFKKKTNISSFKNKIVIGSGNHFEKIQIVTKNNISKFKWNLYFLASPLECTICWSSKSGRIYKTSDEDIDPEDIFFWFEDLDVLEAIKLNSPKTPDPFKLKNLSYILEFNSLNMDLELKIEVDDSKHLDIERLLDKHVLEWNTKAEKDVEDKLGMDIIHNFLVIEKLENSISFMIDMGSSCRLPLFSTVLNYNKYT